jgi:phosphoglucosamine mutase
MGKLFGTDGVRGVANQDLSPKMSFILGQAYASLIRKKDLKARVIIGKDTRISGSMIESAIIAGITSLGVDVYTVGVIPTPGIAYLVRQTKADGGVMISASHNPVEDNGIKFFSPDGFKLTDRQEEEIEEVYYRIVNDEADLPTPIGADVGEVFPYTLGGKMYEDYLVSTCPFDLAGKSIVLDCANGSATFMAPQVFRRLGARVIEINVEPNGVNINVNCGSTHPEMAARAVIRHRTDWGFAYDGDADRVIAIDEKGNIVDGDHMMAFCGRFLLDKNALPDRAIVTTVYSNLGLKESIESVGGKVLTTKAGDRYVLEEMLKNGLTMGGEQSGHLIFLDFNSTGDGILTSLQVCRVIQEKDSPLSVLSEEMTAYPQVLKNVKVAQTAGWETNPVIMESIRQGERDLGNMGRVYVRASGTEPVIRVLAEGKDPLTVAQVVGRIVQVIEEQLR